MNARLALALAAALAFAGAAAAEEAVDVEIVLSVDSSGSIDQREFALQRRGYARALVHPEVLAAIRRGPYGAIALTVEEWSGPFIHTVVVPWTRVAADADAAAVAERLLAAPRTIFGGGTAVGAALTRAAAMFAANGYSGTRRIIDVSGDGRTNRGPPSAPARDAAVAAGIVVNGLAILDHDRWLLRYFEDNVIGGPGAFAIAAETFDDFAEAVLKKLLSELTISRLP